LQPEATTVRSLSFGVGRTSGFSAPESERRVDAYAAPATGHRLKRRLADTIESAFASALQQGDLATAEDLLGVLESMQARAGVSARNERRGADRRLERARRELENRKQARHRRF
jgi:hypothetical protein